MKHSLAMSRCIAAALLALLLCCCAAPTADDLDPYKQYAAYNGYAIIQAEAGQGLVRVADGEIIIPPVYDLVSFFSCGSVRVVKDEKWGAFDGDGKQILPPIYDYISDPGFHGHSYYQLDDLCGFIRNGEILTGLVYAIPESEHPSPWEDCFIKQYLGYTDGEIPGSDPLGSVERPAIVCRTDTTRTDGMDLSSITALTVDPEGRNVEEFVAFLANIYQNTRWYTVDAGGGLTPLTELHLLDPGRDFSMGISMHDYDPSAYYYNSGYLLYMDPYGELLQAAPKTCGASWLLWEGW